MANLITPGSDEVTMVAGVISSNGSIATNPTSGITTVGRPSEGKYIINLSIRYKDPPTITATIQGGRGIATVLEVSNSSFTIRTSDTNNNRANRDFSFIAVEQVS